jgi:hypothetical protein
MEWRDLLTRAIMAALFLALSGLVEAAEDAAPKPDQWRPDYDLITKLERAAKMPEEATAIERSVRYYTGWRTAVSGHRVVFGTIISPTLPLFGSNKPAPSIRIVEPNSMPDFLARNCGIVRLEFNVDTDESVVACSQP